MKQIIPHAITAIIAVTASYFVTTVNVRIDTTKTLQHALMCEQMLITNRIEPICAGFLEQIGYDVLLQGSLHTGEPYDREKSFEIVLNKIGGIK